jgi:hypothetical protein
VVAEAIALLNETMQGYEMWVALIMSVAVSRSSSTVSRGTLTLNVTECGPANLLPAFRAICSGGESIDHVSPILQAQPSYPPGTETGFFDISCPEDIFAHPLKEITRHLPYRLLDQYRSERVPKIVPTLELRETKGSSASGADDDGGLVAHFTPQWGGKVYALQQDGIDLIMKTDPHQPIPSSVRNAQVDGGIEWNWSPGFVGHWADTEDHVFAGKVKTSRGDVLRIWAYDRFNGTAFQVDSVILNGTSERHYVWTI